MAGSGLPNTDDTSRGYLDALGDVGDRRAAELVVDVHGVDGLCRGAVDTPHSVPLLARVTFNHFCQPIDMHTLLLPPVNSA